MGIDVFIILTAITAAFKGLKNGLIIALFSVIGLIIGLAAALKLSVVVAEKISSSSSKLLPFFSFLIVFLAVALLVSIVGRIINKSVQLAMLGWINRFAGMGLYILIYLIILSIIFFYTKQLSIFSDQRFEDSRFYPFIKDLGPWVINSLGKIIPLFKDMFNELQSFFSGIAQKV